MKEKKQCPQCQSKNVIPIKYGMPDERMINDSYTGKIKLGGCCILENANNRHCTDCKYEW